MPDVAPGVTPGQPAGPRLPPLAQCPLLPVLRVPRTARGQGRDPGPLSRSASLWYLHSALCMIQAGSGPRWYSPLSPCMTAAWPSSSQTDPSWRSQGWGQSKCDLSSGSDLRLCLTLVRRGRRHNTSMTHSGSPGWSSAAGAGSVDTGRCTWTPGPPSPRWPGDMWAVSCDQRPVQVYDIYSGTGVLVLGDKGEPAGGDQVKWVFLSRTYWQELSLVFLPPTGGKV